MEKFKKWLSGMKAELKKVVWPKPKKLATETCVSLAFIVAVAALMFGFDQIGTVIVKFFVNLM